MNSTVLTKTYRNQFAVTCVKNNANNKVTSPGHRFYRVSIQYFELKSIAQI